MSSKILNFYTSFKDSSGHEHYAVHGYDRVSGIVTMMKDFKFPDVDLAAYAEEQYEKESERFQIKQDRSEGIYKVLDTKRDTFIAMFYNNSDARAFCEQKNLDEKYLDDMEDTPWN